MKLTLPARLTGEYEDLANLVTLDLDSAKTAFLLVDCDDVNSSGDPVDLVIKQTLAPTLTAVRSVGMKVVFLHSGNHYDAHCMRREHRLARGDSLAAVKPWQPTTPKWAPGVEPAPIDPVIEKRGQSGFRDTVNNSLPEKGRVRLVLTRLFEDHWGYSSTCQDVIAACNMATGGQIVLNNIEN